MLRESISEPRVHEYLQPVLVQDKDFIRKVGYLALHSVHFLQIVNYELLHLRFCFASIYATLLFLHMLLHLSVLVGLLAAWAVYFDLLENLLDFVVDVLGLGLAFTAGALPHHL